MAGFREASGEVPESPRAITPDIERDASQQGRVLRLFGIIYGSIATVMLLGAGVGAIGGVRGLWQTFLIIGTVFGSLGLPCYALGRRAKNATLDAYRHGVECRARITDVFHDFKVRVNKESPWRVRYEMETREGKRVTGTATFWEKPNAEIGQDVIALYHPKRPSHTALWTRLDPIEPPVLEKASKKVRIAVVENTEALEEQAAIDEAAAEQTLERKATH